MKAVIEQLPEIALVPDRDSGEVRIDRSRDGQPAEREKDPGGLRSMFATC